MIQNIILPALASLIVTQTANQAVPTQTPTSGEIEPVSGHEIEFKTLDREQKLKVFLAKYNSPMIENADTFIEVADKYNLDYRLLPAISCVESTCGRFLLQGSHNPFGWGGGYIMFDSFDASIERVGRGLSEIYISRGLDTPEKMSPVYAPPSKTWAGKVRLFMDQIDASE